MHVNVHTDIRNKSKYIQISPVKENKYLYAFDRSQFTVFETIPN